MDLSHLPGGGNVERVGNQFLFQYRHYQATKKAKSLSIPAKKKKTSSFVNTKMRIENCKNLFILSQGYFLQKDSRNTSSQIIKSTPGITKTQTTGLHSCLQSSIFE